MAPLSLLSLNSFKMLHIIFILNLILVESVFGHGPGLQSGRHGGHSHHIPKKDTPENLHKNKDFIRDYEHIKEDLKDQFHQDFTEDLDSMALENYYFQLHDLDKDGRLDGLELLAAINHIMGRDAEEMGIPEEKNAHILLQRWWNVKFEEDAEHIDQILSEQDLDHDGFISYLEFSIGRERGQELR